jgi:hypothetical protein
MYVHTLYKHACEMYMRVHIVCAYTVCYRYAEEHPEAGVLYRGFAIRVWQDPPTVSTSSSSSTLNSGESSSTGSWRADVFLNFYPKFDNAKEAEASDLIQVITHCFEVLESITSQLQK